MNLSPNIWTWVGAFLTLAIFSFLYKDNPFYKMAEHIFVGVANGYAVTFYWHNILMPVLFNPLFRGRLVLIIPLIIGALYFTRFIPKISWLVRIPIGITIGYYTGVAIPAGIEGSIIKQIQGTILTPHNFERWHAGPWGVVWSVILLVGVLCVLSYFYFSKEHKGILKVTSRIGIVFIMIGFGAAFGYTVMGRISLLIGRLQFLLGDWLGIIR
ncbi:hypothetical protein A2Y85_00240 [candidate division WOR-3 bacterium RBG_13_43_14]|uniref:Uncharacterized protein n=1 Tax=candidate division WOR-3 bacterium RBG_13_43_14 TaxID=1802590 RepID=A0A1F4UBB2_UNCW3|nr:MAG: hypothetical protein A2Y85_00240 [candidate division WOR-3 bacterium RBG_13_43_14]